MKKKLVSVLLATTLSVSLCVAGCGNSKQNTDSKKDTTTVETTEKKESVDHEKIKEYIEKADEIVIVKDAKNLDIEKAITSMVTEEQKENVESVSVDDSKVDYTKEGTYPLTITVTVKQESSDQTASTEESTEDPKKGAETSSEKDEDDSKADSTESKDTSSTEEKNDAASTEEVIEDTVDVTVVEKDKADDLLEDGSAVIGDDSKVEIKDEKKEESKKEEIKKEEKKEESKKDDTSQKTDEKKEESVKKEDTKNDTATSNKQETAKKEDDVSTTKPTGNSSSSSTSNNTSSSKPTGSNNSSSTSNNTSSSSSSNTTKPSGNTNSSTTKPTHTHTWVAQTKTVHHDEVGHNEQYVVKAAWDEEVQEAIYDTKVKWICNQCGMDITSDPVGHLLDTDCGGYHSEYEQVVTGYNTYTVHHDAEYGTRWVVDKAAYDETVTTGYKCACGATK